ncbi:type VI secretion system Vgr family protein [Lysobacter sp. Root690]|uniref:type VI secretion system tip protein TssI/VgrG n=1 Tax=Lysobacter sp. Root690 TaxID=1736588 RepID=UPI0009EB0656
MQQILAGLSRFIGAQRLYTLALPQDEGAGEDWAVERWQGWEALSGGFEWWIDVLSVDARRPLDAFLGRHAVLNTRLADGGQTLRSGLVREAQCLGSEGGLARYRLCLVPWTWLLSQGRHSRVYQDKTVAEIVEAVFAAYTPLAVWQWSDEAGPFLAAARPRSYCVQYRETDAAFVDRLLAEEGLGWRLEEDADAPGGHRMVLFAQSGQSPQEASDAVYGATRFHRSDTTEDSDTVQSFGAVRRIASNALTLLSGDYKGLQTQVASVPLGDQDDAAAQLEVYDPVGLYAFADRAEAERYAGLLAQARASERTLWLGRGTVRTFRSGTWFALTDAPQSEADTPREALLVAVQHAGVNNLPKSVTEGISARFGAAPRVPLRALPGASDSAWNAVLARAEAVGYANSFVAVPREQPWRPVLHDGTGARLNPRPTAPGYQTAIVVGPEGATSPQGAHELYCDRLGRLRVKFHFQQSGGDTGSNQAGSNQAESNHSCWLRVAQRYAGPGVGTQFLPRIGQEVLVAFLDGDIDRPVIVGALYNGQGEAGVLATPGEGSRDGDAAVYAQASDHGPSAQANSVGGHAPAWHGMSQDADGHRNAAALVGIKSKEFGGGGHNRLVFDDSDRQLRLQLATTQAATQLNLGHLIHQADNYRGSFRGEGFELRTDQWGAVRAQAGLWISAYDINGETPAGETIAATALLKQASQLGEVLSKVAGTHKTVKLAAHEGVTKAGQSALIGDQPPLRALLTSARTTVDGASFEGALGQAPERKADAGDGKVPHSGDALLGLAAPAGVGFIAGQSLQWAAGETLTLASGQSSNLAVAKDLRIHTGQAIGWLANAVEGASAGNDPALSVVAGSGKLEFEAQHDQLSLQSRDQLKIVSANAEVELAAGKTIHLATAGGASVTIEGGNIVISCPGTITVHAAKKSFVGPAQMSYPLPVYPTSKLEPIKFGLKLLDIPGVHGVAPEGQAWDIVLVDGQAGQPGKNGGVNALVFAKEHWEETLSSGTLGGDGEISLDEAQQQQLYQRAASSAGRVWLVSGLTAMPLTPTRWSTAPEQHNAKRILDALNFASDGRGMDMLREEFLGEMAAHEAEALGLFKRKPEVDV